MEELVELNGNQVLVPIDVDRITAADEIEKEPYILLIDGIGKMSKGNISAWKGKAKSKKTFGLTLIVANMVGRSSLHTKFSPIVSKNIAWVDTEQSPYDAQKVVKRIKMMAGSEDRLFFYALRKYNVETRLGKIETLLKEKGNEIDLLVIDGIRDLIYDFNDARESSELITKLMAWSTEYHLHITTVLHANKSDGNMRGHLGAELENKSETVFSVTKDENIKDVSLIEEDMGRGKNIDSFQIMINANGLPEIVESELISSNEDNDAPY